MNCESAQARLSAVLDGEADRTAALDDHVGRCVECRSFERSAHALRRELRVESVGVSTDVTDAVLAAVSGETRRAERGPRWHRPYDGRIMGMVAALLVLTTIGSFLFGRLSAPGQEIVAADADGTSTGSSEGEVDGVELGSDDNGLVDSPTSGESMGSPSEVGRPELMTLWTPGRLSTGLLGGLDGIEEIDEVSPVRRATVAMTASHDESGSAVDLAASGWAIPIDVIAVDQGRYGALLGSPAIAALGPGQGLLGLSSSRLRGLGPGSTISIEGLTIDVVGVVDDDLIGKAELLVGSSTGYRLGVDAVRYAVLTSSEGQSVLEQQVANLADGPFRLSNRLQSPTLRNSDAVLAQIDLKLRFGEFALRATEHGFDIDPVWFDANIIVTTLPLIGPITCHRQVIAALELALADLAEAGFGGMFDGTRFQGCWNPRTVGGTDDVSHHSWGVALDLLEADAASRLDPSVVKIMEQHGFTWGGDWLHPDPAHFEYLGGSL